MISKDKYWNIYSVLLLLICGVKLHTCELFHCLKLSVGEKTETYKDKPGKSGRKTHLHRVSC